MSSYHKTGEKNRTEKERRCRRKKMHTEEKKASVKDVGLTGSPPDAKEMDCM